MSLAQLQGKQEEHSSTGENPLAQGQRGSGFTMDGAEHDNSKQSTKQELEIG